jgi:acetyl esterase/lipase
MTEADDAYANAPYIPGGDAYPARWSAQAAAFRDACGPRADLDVAYGASARERYDLFRPERPARGTLVFVHGGFWRAFDKSVWSHLAAGALGRGWAAAMPSYTLCPEARIADITRQIAAAVTAIAAATEGPLTLAGHSAGGHLVARMLDPRVLDHAIALRICRVMPISPLADLTPLMETAMNAELRIDAAEALAESPLHMTLRHAVPVTVWVGEDERPAFLDQARWLATEWTGEHVITPGRHHFDVIDDLTDPDSRMVHLLTGAGDAEPA